MEEIKVYTSRKKSLALAAGGLLMVAGCVWFIFQDDYHHLHPVAGKIIGIVGTLFFGICLVNIIHRLIIHRLFLIIDGMGICVDTIRAPHERVEWKHIEGFTEETVRHRTRFGTVVRQKFIVICVNNPQYWIDRQPSAWRRGMMKWNVQHNGSPFHISTNATQMSHDELLQLLCDSLHKYKPK